MEHNSPEINPHSYSQLMTKEARIYNGEMRVSSTSSVRKTRQIPQKTEIKPFSYSMCVCVGGVETQKYKLKID